MAAAIKQNLDEWKKKLDAALHEKNKFTNVLEKIEVKTGVKRLNIALGKFNTMSHDVFCFCVI